jgi:glyoxylase-like metal-dependent hydrolase (beta-lactamase superfamily II)
MIHHLNCGTMHPFGLPRDDDTGGFFRRGHGVLHCLLIETGDGLVLIDTGWGLRDFANPAPVVRQFMSICGFTCDPEETAVRQIAALGYDPADVRHIFLTHMHLDHAGGLPDFPSATVHLSVSELEAYLHPRSYMERYAYRPEHGAHNPRWKAYPLEGALWFGRICAPPIHIGEAEFVMIPFAGHTRGHCAIAVRTGGRWLLHCGDAYGYFRQVDPAQPYAYPCGKLMETIVTTGFRMPRRHWVTLRKMRREHGDQIRMFCSHDAQEYNAFHSNITANHV